MEQRMKIGKKLIVLFTVIALMLTVSNPIAYGLSASDSFGQDAQITNLVGVASATNNATSSKGKSIQNFVKNQSYQEGTFQDVQSQWFANGVKVSYELGLIKGKDSKNFQPQDKMSLAEAITIAARVHSIYYGGGGVIPQKSGQWYQGAVSYAIENGIIKDGQFQDYKAPATRGDLAYVFAHAVDATALPIINKTVSISDVNAKTTYNLEITTLYKAGVLTGSGSNNEFRPTADITRAEAATIISRLAGSNKVTTPTKTTKIVKIEMENGDVIKAELYPKVAPTTVANFISLVEKGFYNGLIFHRVIPGFMIQGGDPLGTGTGGPGYAIPGEFSENGFKNNLSHERGILSMARSSDPNSAGSQFFITVANASFLDGKYAAFGKVIQGMDVVDKIVAVQTASNDKPTSPQKMKKVTIEEVTQ